MKKLISIFLLLAMLTAIVPLSGITAVAADTPWDGTYDVSWCTAGTENGTDSVQIDGNWYKVLNYASGTVFEIKDAADLAGISVLTNTSGIAARGNPFFANCTFYITADINLTGHDWTAIARRYNQGYTFGANLIGSKGDATTGNGGVITITGMTVNETGSGQNAAGLIGVQSGGSIQNITLKNAKVTSASADGAGSFVGHQWGVYDASLSTAQKDARSQTIYRNLTSDAVIKRTSASTAAHCAAGGITGVDNNGIYVTKYENCTFTGTIDNNGNKSGGISGYGETGGAATAIYYTNCIVTSPSIFTRNTTSDGSNRGCGGLVGVTKANTYANGCYVSATVHSGAAASVTVGGMMGRMLDASIISFENCHFDGIVYAENWYLNAAFVGATSSSTGKALVFKNCLNTGMAMNEQSYLSTKGMPWLGYISTNGDRGYAITFENNFSACKSLYMQYLQDNKKTNISVNGTAITAASEVTNLATNVVNIKDARGELANASMAGLFGADTKWTTRSGSYPTLTIAKNANLADTTYATADYAWFDYSKTGDAATEIVLDDKDELLALSKIAKSCSSKHTFANFLSEYKIKLSTALKASVTTELFSAADVATLNGVVVGTINDENVNNLKIQQSTIEGNNAVRISAQIKGYEWDNATFEYFITYTGNDGVEYSSVIKTAEVHNCYTQIYAGDTPVDPQNDGYYFVVLVISDIDDSWTDVKVSFTVSVEKDGVTTYSTPVEYPAENPLEF